MLGTYISPQTRAPKPLGRSWISKTNATKGDRDPAEGHMESVLADIPLP
jgi:hypothetical protein